MKTYTKALRLDLIVNRDAMGSIIRTVRRSSLRTALYGYLGANARRIWRDKDAYPWREITAEDFKRLHAAYARRNEEVAQ